MEIQNENERDYLWKRCCHLLPKFLPRRLTRAVDCGGTPLLAVDLFFICCTEKMVTVDMLVVGCHSPSILTPCQNPSIGTPLLAVDLPHSFVAHCRS